MSRTPDTNRMPTHRRLIGVGNANEKVTGDMNKEAKDHVQRDDNPVCPTTHNLVKLEGEKSRKRSPEGPL